VFIDAEKEEYPDYLEHALRFTKAGNMISAHNMFWGGTILRPAKNHEGSAGIREYTRRIFCDSRLCSIIVPLGDGMAVSYRIE